MSLILSQCLLSARPSIEIAVPVVDLAETAAKAQRGVSNGRREPHLLLVLFSARQYGPEIVDVLT